MPSSGSLTPSDFLAKETEATWQWRIDTDPELAASLGLLSVRRSKHALDPRSLESFDQRLSWVRSALARVKSGITPEQVEKDLTKIEKISLELYVKQLTDYIHYHDHKAFLCCVNRLEGPQTDLALYARYIPVKTKENRQFYLDFLKAIPRQLDEVMALLRAGIDEGRTPPRISLGGVVDQIGDMIEAGLTQFTKPIEGCFPPEEKGVEDECRMVIETVVADAFSKFQVFLRDEYIPNLSEEISSVKRYPNGEAYYADCLAFHTTTNMSPDEIHQLGLDEVKRVRDAMTDIAKDEGYDDLTKYLEYLRTSKTYEPSSSESLLAKYRDILGRISPNLLRIIHLNTLPRQPVEVVETPSSSASMAPAAYYLAGSTNKNSPRPGMFYVNTSELSTRRTYECEALALHEGLPGHHTQGAIQGELPLPTFRKLQEDRRYFEAPSRFPFYTAYIEGWGLHSETLGAELGLYESNSDKIGQLSMESLRSCRLVVDTGMHALGWSHEQAVQYMLQNTAMGEHDARTEVTRYCTWPGQATAYKVGERFIRRLRTKAESAIGASFDPRDFYEVVLRCGAVPLDILEQLVDEFIGSATIHGEGISAGDAFVSTMTFANWCKCCVVPGSCSTPDN